MQTVKRKKIKERVIRSTKEKVIHEIVFAFFHVYAFTLIYSFLFLLFNSFKDYEAIADFPMQLPNAETFVWDSYLRAWFSMKIGRMFFNTVTLSVGQTFVSMAMTCMAAYTLAKYPFKANTTIYTIILVASVVPVNKKDPTQNPATRTFQGIRIHINGELDELQKALDAAMGLLRDGGRLAIITFHSLEDRLVKRYFDRAAHPERGIDSRVPLRADQLPQPTLVEVKRILPDAQECAENPRARSAILRVATRSRKGEA